MSDLRPLKAWLVAHPSPDEAIATVGGGTCSVEADGERVIQFPYPIYATAMGHFWAAVEATGWTIGETCGYAEVVRRWLATNGPGL